MAQNQPITANRLFVVRSPEGISVMVGGYGFAVRIKGERLVISHPLKSDSPPELQPLFLAEAGQSSAEKPQEEPKIAQGGISSETVQQSAKEGQPPGKTELEGGTAVYEPLQLPLREISEILLSEHGGSLTTDFISSAMERGINLYLMKSNGEPVAAIVPPVANATIEIRRAQIAIDGTPTGRYLAHAFLSAKNANQVTTLLYFTKYLRQSDPPLAKAIRQAADEISSYRQSFPDPHLSHLSSQSFRNTLMGIEGNAASVYWSAVAKLLKNKVAFPGRLHRGAADPVNSLLNYGYGILYSHIWGAVLRAGLDPYAGFLHADRPGKPSLVLDLVEEFRSWVVDRTVISMFHTGFKVITDRDGRLSRETRAELADRILRRLDSRERHLKKSELLRNIFQIQARQVAAIIRGRQREYIPFHPKW